MNLVDSGRRVGLGATAGALIALLLYHLHVGPIFGNPDLIVAIVGGLAIGSAAAAFGWERWLLVISAILIVVYFFVTDSPVMGQIADRWVRDDGPPAQQDAIVVLSGYVQLDSAIDADATERLLSGMELYKAGVAPKIVTSRVETSDGGTRRSSSADVRRLLELAGATPGWIEVDSVSSTHDEAVRMAAVLLPGGIARIALVTSAFHTRRACATFEAVGFVVSCQPARDRAVMKRRPTNSSSRLAAFGDYVYERLGMIKYRRMGWLPPKR